MTFTKMNKADLDSPCREPSNGDLGIVVALSICWYVSKLHFGVRAPGSNLAVSLPRVFRV